MGEPSRPKNFAFKTLKALEPDRGQNRVWGRSVRPQWDEWGPHGQKPLGGCSERWWAVRGREMNKDTAGEG